MLSNEVSIAPDGGFGFGPRHLDFHPSQPWVYVSLERQNALDMFELQRRHAVGRAALPQADAGGRSPAAGSSRHGARASEWPHGLCRQSRAPVNRGSRGENSLAVYAIDPATGEPNLIQHVDTHGMHPRTFHIDPSGRLMAVAHITGAGCRCSASPRTAGWNSPAPTISMSGERTMWWMGMVEHAA